MDDDRKYDCTRYRRCLAAAARRNASGLPCGACERYRRVAGLSPHELQGCTELLAALFGDKHRRHIRAGARF
jgi:hypothetical protein